ncbi:hypothetical protein [Magnetospira sp. QH-2]|uniref:DUF7660 family protein n=1 Tax=Magnetospira sp. (strain QH-2) TaxID=1288970 RepID=UPI0005FA6EB0|nr:hypothetical protein [Magnetospira sp. QH-2]
MDDDDYFDKLDRLEETIATPDELSDFVALLNRGYSEGLWEEQGVVEYLGGIEGVLDGLEGLCKNYGFEYPEQPSWAWFARILRVAFGHS